MGSESWRAWPYAAGLALRGLIVGVLVWGAARLVVGPGYYATAVVLLGLAAVVTADLVRQSGLAGRTLRAFAEGLAAGAIERPARPMPAFQDVTSAISRAADRLEAERIDSQRRTGALEALLDTVSTALFVLSSDGRILFANRAARALAGEEADRLGRLTIIGPELAGLLESLTPGAREVVRLRGGRAALAGSAAYSLPGGERRRLISLQTIAGELDAVELKAWRDLAHVLAHEMMNSLTPIVSLAESLETMLSDDGAAIDRAEVVSAVQVIARRSTGLMSFVDRYRKVADLPTPAPAEVRASALVAGLDRLFEPMLKGRGVDCRTQVQPTDLTLLVDPDLIEQAVLNILKNGLEAVAGRPGGALQLSCRLDAEGSAVISVADNGPGLPGDIERLFLPFYSTRSGGSGIGLSLARQIAQAHHGRVLAENAGDGARVSIVLPPGCVLGPADSPDS